MTERLALAFAIDRIDADVREKVVELCVQRWFPRGDAALVYCNEDFGSPSLGMKVVVSYGGPEAQIERKKFAKPPEQLPDGLTNNEGGTVNWRYRLEFIIDPELSEGSLE